MEQEYNYNNTDYEDEFTYADVESRFKVIKNDDGTYSYEEKEEDLTEDDLYEQYQDEQAESIRERNQLNDYEEKEE